MTQGLPFSPHNLDVLANGRLGTHSADPNARVLSDPETIVDEDSEFFIRENLLLLDIFYAQDGRQIIIHRPAYDFYSLLCDIGGALALLCGASVLTSLELIDVIL